MAGRVVGAVGVTVLLSAGVALAQEEPPPPPIPPRPADEPPPPIPPRQDGGRPDETRPAVDATAPGFFGFALGDVSDAADVGDEKVIAAVGGVTQPVAVRIQGFSLRCRNAVLWGDRDKLEDAIRNREKYSASRPEELLGPVIHAVYAEGDVHFVMQKQKVRAESVFFDFVRGTAYFVHAEMGGALDGSRRTKLPITVRADVIRAKTRNLYEARNARITTCTYSDPHFEFTTDSIEVDYAKGDGSFETSWWPSLRMDTLLGDDTPVFAFPKLAGSTGLASTPLQGVGFSQGSRFGFETLVTWGGDIERADGSKWGEWRLHTDWRSARGPGLGVELSHESAPSAATKKRDLLELSAYWQRDGEDRDTFSDRAFDGSKDISRSDRNRGFAHLFHRWHVEDEALTGTIGSGWRVDSNVSWYSDRGYLPEYDDGRAETDDQQESFVHARKTWGNEGVSILTSYRLNDEAAALRRMPSDLLLTDYENQTQYLPSATYHMVNEPLVSPDGTGLFPVNLSLQASAANVKRRYDDRLADRLNDTIGWLGEDVRRGDLEARVTTPFSLGDVHLDPAFGGSLMHASDANGFTNQRDGSDGRYAAFWGMRAGTQAWKLHDDVGSDLLDLHGIRHVASIDAQYFDRFHVSEDPGTFQGNDLVDELPEERIASLRLRNRLQTKRDGEVVDWLDAESRFLYYFERPEPSFPFLFGLREEFAQPLQALDFPGSAKYSAGGPDGSAYWQHRARMELRRDLWLVGEADYDFAANAMETSAVGVRYRADEHASFYLGRRTIHGDSAIWTMRMDYRLSNRWGLELEHQQDSKSNRGLRTTLGLYRRAHDYTVAIEVTSDSQGDQSSVGLAIYPNDWMKGGETPFSLRRPLDYDALKWYR